MDIEGYAVAQVISILAQTDRLIADLSLRDKIPIWDGSIRFYSDTQNHPNNSLLKRIPTQVKGQIRKTICRGTAMYSIRVCDLLQFKKEGGAIFFVVHIAQMKNGIRSKIFYAKLLPFSIMEKVRLHQGQDEISFEFREFPCAEKKITMLFSNLISDIEKQLSIAVNESVPTLEKLQSSGIDTSKYQMKITAMKGENPFLHFFEDSTFLYVKNTLGQYYPVQEIPPAKEVKQTNNLPVSCAGKKYYDSYSTITSITESRKCYGRSLEFVHNYKNKTGEICFTLQGTISERIIDISFFLDLMTEKQIELGETICKIDIQKIKTEDVENLRNKKKLLQDISTALKTIGATDEVDIDMLSEEELSNLSVVLEAFGYHRAVHLSVEFSSGFIHKLRIGKQNLLVMGIPLSGKNKFQLHNFCKTNLAPSITIDDKLKRISQFMLLEKDDWQTATNIDYDFVFNTIEEEIGITPEYEADINQTLLVMLAAYDELDVKNSELLELIIRIANKWQMLPNLPDETKYIYKLNYLQAVKRKQELSATEKEFLENLTQNAQVDLCIQVGAYILLENFETANLLFSRLGANEKSMIINFPIANLWENRPC